MDAAWPDGAVWPCEFQHPELYLRKGHITNWDFYPEYVEGDMFALKTLDLRMQWDGPYPQISSALPALALVYCFWIAYADVDGFRIDAAKHMGEEALRTFCDVIKEFAQTIGKENFLLAGEIGGSREQAWEVVEKTGLNAALGIEDVPGKLERMVAGYADPEDYFSLFRNWILEEPAGHRWYRNQVVTLVDDHDQVRKGNAKCRFCGDPQSRDLAFNVLAVQMTTMGIPCVYYGSEQGFDSGGRPASTDLVLRETMFGGSFGGDARRAGTSSTRTTSCTAPSLRSSTCARNCCRCGGAGRRFTASRGTASISACRAAWASGCARWCAGRVCWSIRKSWSR